VAVPEDVGLDDIEAAVLGLLDQPGPHLPFDSEQQEAVSSEMPAEASGS
jgi:hypothetical protein